MTSDDEIRTMLRDAGVPQATDDHVRAVRQLSESAACSLPLAVQTVRTAVDEFALDSPRRGRLRALFDRVIVALHRQHLERERYLNASPEIREAYLTGYGHGLADAPLIRP